MKMDPTSAAAAACFMVDDEDDLLNFTLEDETLQQLDNTKDPSSSSFSSHHPECVEEELEWLSNKDAFPAIEFGILSDNQGLVFDHHSPVSVLENSSSTSNNSGNANGSAYMSCCASLKVPVNYPVRARSKRRRRRRRGDLTDVPIEHCMSVKNPASFKSAKQQQPLLLQPMNSARIASIGRRCQHCGVDKTPQWRAGPMGPKTLCNACGVRYKSGRLLPEYRPANSPTFSADLHSNSHRKVLEMRKQKTRVGGMMIHETCGYRPPWLIVDAEESFDVPIEHCLSVNQASFKNKKHQQPLLSLQMNSARSASIGRKYQDGGVDKTQKWQAGHLGPKTLCKACGAHYKSVNQASVKNNNQQQPLLSLPRNSAKSASIGRRCQDCGVDKTPKWLAGPLGPKTLCSACGVPYNSVNQASVKNNNQQQPLLSLPINSAKSASIGRSCQDCGVEKTPKWLAGPLGPKTLCNACGCGVRYKSVIQMTCKNNNQQQPLVSLPMNFAKSDSIGRRCQDCGVDKTPKWLAGPLGPKTLCKACGVRYKLVNFRNANQQPPLISLPMNSAKSDSIERRCQDCGVDKIPKWLAGPLGPKTLCKACGVRYKSGRLLPEYFPANSPTTRGLIVEAEDFFDVPIEHCLSVNQASFKKTKQQQSLLSFSMNSAKSASIGRRCQHCGVNKTPQWRAGPLGQKTLCNACGVRYRSGRLFPEYRPANSPTFSAALHSNSHQKVLEMRKGVGKNDDS